MRTLRPWWGLSVWIAVAGCVEYEPGAALDAGPPTADELLEGFALETFEGGGESTVDVIVFGDTSGSMEVELETLGETITPFVERLANYVDDWQLAAVTDGSGCAEGGILTPDTARFADKFADALVQPINDNESSEQGLQNVIQAIEKSGPGECNAGLVRGGMLQLLFVSDENDESPGFDEAPDYWRDYVDRIVEIHGDPTRIKISAVAGPAPLGCLGADPGFGYDGPVKATGGEFLSICDDWASQIDLVADTIAVRATFPLADPAVPGTVRVWVNDRELPPVQIDYDARTDVVTITPGALRDDVVSIEYEVADGA